MKRIPACLVILLFAFSAAGAAGAEKNQAVPFDFPALKQEDVAKRYVKHNFRERKNPLFRFEMVFPRDWKAINIREPAGLPDNGDPVEIGAFHRFRNPNDPKSPILAGIYVAAARVPAGWSDVQAVDRVTEHLLKGHPYKVLTTREYRLSRTTLKDILLAYNIPGERTYWSRITGFKVKDGASAPAAGKSDIFYVIHLHTSEKDYRAFAAEAFYVAKTSLRPE